MEKEIDLFKYFRILLRRWYLIVGAGILFALVAFLVTNQPKAPVYRATALVGVTRTYLDLQLADEFPTINQAQNVSRAYPELALSDAVMLQLAEIAEEETGEPHTLLGIRGMASAALGEDISLLRLQITNADPKFAAFLANKWAELFVLQAERVYGVQSDTSAAQLQEQLGEAETNLLAADDALVASRENDQVTALASELKAITDAHAALLAQREQLVSLLADTRRFRDEMANAPSSEPGNANDQITLLLLQMKAFGLDGSSSLIAQVSGADTTTENTVGDQLAEADGLISALEQKQTELAEQIAVLNASIRETQTDHEIARLEQTRLLREQTMADAAYTALAQKVEEVALAASDTTGNVRLASRAAIPQAPLGQGRRQLFVVIGAALAGMLLASVAVLAVSIYRESLEE